jgi:hypothetical protein
MSEGAEVAMERNEEREAEAGFSDEVPTSVGIFDFSKTPA